MAGFETIYGWTLRVSAEGEFLIGFGGNGSFKTFVYDPENPDSRDITTFQVGDKIVQVEESAGVEYYTYYKYIGHTSDGWIGQAYGGNPDSPLSDQYVLLNNTWQTELDPVPITWSATDVTFCFLEGTLIATDDGWVAVESLQIGGTVLDHEGRPQPIKWIGRQTIASVFADPLKAFPIRIQADALADGVPRRDLFLSPGHALLVDGLLVQAGALVNGTTITQLAKTAERFTYYHIETEGHAVILAEGASAETFVDNSSRQRFDNYAEFVALYGTPEASMDELDSPRVKSARQLPAAIRDRLAKRAAKLGLGADAAA